MKFGNSEPYVNAWGTTQVPLFTARHVQLWYTHATNEIVLGLYQVCGWRISTVCRAVH